MTQPIMVQEAPAEDTLTEIFGEPIYSYTRAQALEDGVLVDVSEMAREAGWACPVAVTAAVWALIEDIPPSKRYQDVQGRLWDVLWMGRFKAYLIRRSGVTQYYYRLILYSGRRKYQVLKVVCGPGDDGELVVTIMLPHED